MCWVSVWWTNTMFAYVIPMRRTLPMRFWCEIRICDFDANFAYAISMRKSKHSNPLNIWKILVPMHRNMKLQWKCYVWTFFAVELFLAVKWFRSHVLDTRFSLPVNKIITCFFLNHLHVFLKVFRSFARWK